MSSGLGFPDWQRITQWVGQPVASQTGLAIGAGVHDDGPFQLSSWASVVVAITPTGGPVTVTVKQKLTGAPVSLEDDTTFVVPAGGLVFESVVLFGDQVSVHIAGAIAGTTVDYAVYPSNTTTNAQVLASAVLGFQHNHALVASEPALDLSDGAGVSWLFSDDPANSRMQVAPVAKWELIGRQTVFGTSPLFSSIPQTYQHLKLIWYAYQAAETVLSLIFNGDTTANYNYGWCETINGAANNGESLATQALGVGIIGTAAGAYQGEAEIPDYRSGLTHRAYGKYVGRATNRRVGIMGGDWGNGANITSIQVANAPTGGVFSLYGLG